MGVTVRPERSTPGPWALSGQFMGVPGWSLPGKRAWGGPRGGPSSPALAASASGWREPTR